MQLTTKFGNPAPSTQTIVDEEDGRLFLSYGTKIAKRFFDGKVVLYPAWNYSATTAFYRSQFLGEGTAATRQKIDSGEYTVEEDGA